MSGYPGPLDDTHPIQPGDGFIQKPFNPDELMQELGKLLSRAAPHEVA